ncbi:MAG: M28 family peptidase [Acidobacteria bacterium]|nr:M28 family peptidase [Acidobacteriota bacterium]
MLHALPSQVRKGLVCLLLVRALAPGSDLERLAALDATAGEEQAALAYVLERLGPGAQADATRSASVTFGDGSPHTLLTAGLDEPGYAISEITAEGYLRLHRVAEPPPSYQFDSHWPGWPVKVSRFGRDALPGVMAAPSVHFNSDRGYSGGSRSLEGLYVDIGALSAEEVAAAGVALLDRVTLAAPPVRLGDAEVAAPWLSSHAGAALLLRLADLLRDHPPKGRVTLAFTSQQNYHNAGLLHLLRRHQADRAVVIRPGGDNGLAVSGAAGWSSDLTTELRQWGQENGVRVDSGGSPKISFGPFAPEDAWKQAGQSVALTLGPRNSGTPAESLAWADLDQAGRLLAWLAGLPGEVPFQLERSAAPTPIPAQGPRDAFLALLDDLVRAPGVSQSEQPVRDSVRALIPRRHAPAVDIDDRGNLIVRLGGGESPAALFLAHLDEVGFHATRADGHDATVETRGGLSDELFAFHPMTGWRGAQPYPALMGRSGQIHAGVEPQPGDVFTPAKALTMLLGERISARSLDDRAGCAILLTALSRLAPVGSRKAVWFVFTVEEEIGLYGAESIALRTSPARVYAIDSLVTSDSPLEPTRLGHLELGQGVAIRAIDNSGLSPRSEVERVLAFARAKGIPARAGVTAGGNDGSKFAQAGAVNVPLAFPLRYSHTAAEVADLRDLRALVDLVTALAADELGAE